MEAAQDEEYARIEAEDAAFVGGLLALLLDGLVHILAGFLDDLLDACRLDAAVLDELAEGDGCSVAADWVERRYSDGARSVVDEVCTSPVSGCSKSFRLADSVSSA